MKHPPGTLQGLQGVTGSEVHLQRKPQAWKQTLPGALLAAVLFFVILQVFPLYLAIFPPNQAYAAFGVFLLLMFWVYLLGIVLVLGAELNAFLEEPARLPRLRIIPQTNIAVVHGLRTDTTTGTLTLQE